MSFCVFPKGQTAPQSMALSERSVLRIFMEVRARVRTAAPAVRKSHVSEVSGHQSGHRVWGGPELKRHQNPLQNSANTTPALWGSLFYSTSVSFFSFFSPFFFCD